MAKGDDIENRLVDFNVMSFAVSSTPASKHLAKIKPKQDDTPTSPFIIHDSLFSAYRQLFVDVGA